MPGRSLCPPGNCSPRRSRSRPWEGRRAREVGQGRPGTREWAALKEPCAASAGQQVAPAQSERRGALEKQVMPGCPERTARSSSMHRRYPRRSPDGFRTSAYSAGRSAPRQSGAHSIRTTLLRTRSPAKSESFSICAANTSRLVFSTCNDRFACCARTPALAGVSRTALRITVRTSPGQPCWRNQSDPGRNLELGHRLGHRRHVTGT